MSVLDLGAEVSTIAEAERHLAALRRRASAAAREGVTPPARAAVMNIVVYAKRRVHAERAARVIARLGEQHPSRAIVVFHDGDDQERIVLRCHQAEGTSAQICFEQIVVRSGAATAHQLRSIVIPLLISDLPVFLWWTETPPLLTPLFRAFSTVASRLVVDSADFVRPELTLPAEERCCRNRQIRPVEALQRREVLVAELVDPLRCRQILQPVLAQVAQPIGARKRSG